MSLFSSPTAFRSQSSNCSRPIYINLQHNQFSELNATFQSLVFQCGTIDLSYNVITLIEPNSFTQCTLRGKLSLANNKLTSLNKEILLGLCALSYIDLSNNEIMEIQPSWYSSLSLAMKKFDMSGNPSNCKIKPLLESIYVSESNLVKCKCAHPFGGLGRSCMNGSYGA